MMQPRPASREHEPWRRRSRTSSIIAIAACALVFMGGCPDERRPATGGGDTGGPQEDEVEPLDPLNDGAASSCDPSSGGPWVPWASPSSLGNGLVHDSRLSLGTNSHQEVASNTKFALEGVAWSSFVTDYDAMRRVGFRPAQLHSEITVTPESAEESRLTVVDRSLYIADDDANYRTEIETYLFPAGAAEQGATTFAPAALGARPRRSRPSPPQGERSGSRSPGSTTTTHCPGRCGWA
jgi:hypothetical protein